MKITILSIAPEQFNDFLKTSLIHRAREKGVLDIEIKDIRDYAPGSFRKVDDSPYGGGPGMLLRVQPIADAIADSKSDDSHVLILAPIGKRFDQKDAHRLAEMKHLILVCGHYEGFDQRVYEFADEIISIGDYILCGGELPAMVISEAVTRLIEGTIKRDSIKEESFEDGLLEYPQYTRPAEYKGMKVPDVLLSGNDAKIKKWRRNKAIELTKERRADLLEDRKD